MPKPEAGERRATAEPVKYNQGKPVVWKAGYQAGKQLANWAQRKPNDNVASRLRLMQQQQDQRWERSMAELDKVAQEALYQNDPSYRSDAMQRQHLQAQWQAEQQRLYNGAGSMGNMYARQGMVNQPRAAQAQGRVQAAPLPLFTNGVYNGAGSMANMYAAQGREYDINASKWSSLRKQQAAYHSTLGQDTTQGAYYFGPGSAEQLYATQAYANAPISMPVVPVDYGGGGGYGYGGGYGGGSSYVAPEPDIPRWLYGMLSWRYR